MKKPIVQSLVAIVFAVYAANTFAADELLSQVGAIPLRGVEGRVDHMSATPDGRYLFVAALGNNTVEKLDTQSAVPSAKIEGIKEPQGVFYIPDSKKLVVACGGDDNARIYDADLKPVAKIDDLADADNVRFDPKAKLIYVGYGSGALAVIDPEKGKKVADINLDGHPESFRLESSGDRIFVNVPEAKEIEVVDRQKRAVIAKWPMKDAQANFPMTLIEADHRLLVGCRKPSKLVVLDTESGKVITVLDCCGDTDDLFFDAASKRVLVTGGEGCISVFEETDADHFKPLAKIPTAPGARTSFFVEQTHTLYVAVPHRGPQKAEMRVYRSADQDASSAKQPLPLVKTFPLPEVSGGFNHLGADAKEKHLFLTATHDAKLDVLDLANGKLLRQIEGPAPAAAVFAPDLRQILVTRGSKLFIYDGNSFDEVGQVDVGSSMDELRYDARTKRVYVGCMTNGATAIATVDVVNRKVLNKMSLPGRPQGFQIESNGPRIFVNVPSVSKVVVLDHDSRATVAQWDLKDAQSNFPIALDDANQRLFVGCRRPAKLLVLDTNSGKSIASVDIVSDTDDLAYDAANKRIYVCGGQGQVSVIEQKDADHYTLVGNIDTAPGARNSVLIPEMNRFYVAVPQRENQPAEVRAYETASGRNGRQP